MEHAWLDSLSEDWVSEPRSDRSATHLEPRKGSGNAAMNGSHELPSQIPRKIMNIHSPLSASRDSSINVLSERSANEINITRSRLPSKLSQQLQLPGGNDGSRSVSTSTNGSVVHNTVSHQSSLGKDNSHTPEWKRRLVYGKIQYGEQRDLFCSAAEGLQDMFKPPSEPQSPTVGETEEYHDATLPSSPPFYAGGIEAPEIPEDLEPLEEEDLGYSAQITPSQVLESRIVK